MDGAMGTELQRRGLGPGECGELWNLSRPDVVAQVHAAYAAAGARCLLTNTFQANPLALARYGQQDLVEDICRAGVELARSSAGEGRFVLASIGPLLAANGEETADLEALRRTIRGLIAADALVLETWSSPTALAAARAAAAHLPVILSLTYRRHQDGRLTTLSGHDPEWFARQAREHGLSGLGVNCGRDIGPAEVAAILKEYRRATDLPLLARVNAGRPSQVGGGWVYPLGPRELAERLPDLVAAGAALVGGCCGTTPEHIRAGAEVLKRG
jgi:5-methyltetrahydrofolate--homocysteine methyltransferase